MSVEDRNTKLMKRMGSPTGRWNPEAPDQNLFVLNCGKEQILRGAAWVKANTTERVPGSPFCVDAKGKALHVEDMARGCGWQPQTGRNVLAEMEAAGLAKVARDRRIWQCADIPLAHHTPKNGRRKREQSNSVQSCFSGEVLDSIERLPQEKLTWVKARCGEYLEWRPTLFSDGMAALRNIDERMKNNILRGVGIEKKTPEKERKNGRKPAKMQLELNLLAVPNFVQSYGAGAIRTELSDDSVQVKSAAVSFMYSDSSLQTTTTPKVEPGAPVEDFVVVAEKLKSLNLGWISQPALKRLLEYCKKKSPGCTGEDVAALIGEVGRTINKGNTRNAVGVIIEAVKDGIADYRETHEQEILLKAKAQADKRQAEIEALRAIAADPDETEEARADCVRRLEAYGVTEEEEAAHG